MTRTNHLTVQAQIALHAALHRIKPSDITGESKAQRYVIPRKLCFLALVCEVIGHKPDGTPTSLSFGGPLYQDADVLSLAHAFQKLNGAHTRRPPAFA